MKLRFLATSIVVPVLVAACGGEASRSPACGLARIAGPGLFREHLLNARAVITDAPRGLPDSLPAMVIQQTRAWVRVAYDPEGKTLVMGYEGPGFPARGGYGLLVVDDTSHRAVGVLIYESEEPKQHPRLGTITGGAAALNLYGVRVDWSSVSNPTCPLLGGPTTQPTS